MPKVNQLATAVQIRARCPTPEPAPVGQLLEPALNLRLLAAGLALHRLVFAGQPTANSQVLQRLEVAPKLTPALSQTFGLCQ